MVEERNSDYVDQKVREFAEYLALEIAILECKGVHYVFAYQFLETTIQRIQLFIQHNTPIVPNHPETTEDFRIERIECLKNYLDRIENILMEQSQCWIPEEDGSFWEDVSKSVGELAQSVRLKKRE